MGSIRLLGKTQESWELMFFMLFIRSKQYILSYVKTTTKSKDTRTKKTHKSTCKKKAEMG